MILVNLGCSNTYYKDWLNIDFVSQNTIVKANNLLNGTPLDSNTVDILYHSHVLSRANTNLNSTQSGNKYEQGLGNKIRRKLASFILGANDTIISKNNQTLKLWQFRKSGEIHQWMYDRYSLKKLLRETGFSDIKVLDGHTSTIKNWNAYNLDLVDGKVRKPDSLFMEARKA